MMTVEPMKTLEIELKKLSNWLDNQGIPLWLSQGVDQASGGFYERIGQDRAPMIRDNRRARVQPRQLYCFAAARQRGLEGPWDLVLRNGLGYFEKTFRKDDGTFGALASPEGDLIDPSFDLYNQAFALFAFAQLAATIPDASMAMEEKATDLFRVIRTRYKHPVIGFEHSDPPSLPLCSNPHMHLFEAALAWEAIAERPAEWTALADEIAELAMTRFIDSRSGGLREFFDRDWKPHPSDKGRIMEPGHQFEWAWLLARWGSLRGHRQAIAKAERLFEIGITHGMSEDGKVAIMSLYDDFTVHDPVARMWPQTEWLKAATKLAAVGTPEKREHYLHSAIAACQAFELFLQTPVKGLWYDKRSPDGRFIDEPAPASTFYHIVCAILDANDTVAGL
jgi:mannose-6-phosphate isomerase